MDPIKEAFSRAKQDISDLKEQISSLSREISSLKELFYSTTQQTDRQTNQHTIPTHKLNEHHNMPLEASKAPISIISTGNRGVPTDRQTNQQTDRHIENKEIPQIQRISSTLDSLNFLKEELKAQFKHLTRQEMVILVTIYQLEEQGSIVDYSILAKKLSLSESSIRDYTLKLIKKGIPIQKTKENNKHILLTIPSEMKKMASLQTILSFIKE